MSLGLQYRLPAVGDAPLLHEYVKEHYFAGERSISAGMGLPSGDYEEWIEVIIRNATIANGEWGRSSSLLCFCKQELIGMLHIRCELSVTLRYKYGDIGYGVKPSQRRKGFASEMLRYGLTVCGDHGMDRVIIGCYKDNIASVKTILKNNGRLILEWDEYKKGKLSQYYQIDI